MAIGCVNALRSDFRESIVSYWLAARQNECAYMLVVSLSCRYVSASPNPRARMVVLCHGHLMSPHH
jgi:hypothetical protein